MIAKEPLLISIRQGGSTLQDEAKSADESHREENQTELKANLGLNVS